ncbi:uncharacterized protein LOC133904817 [Phragmites australis]|uniref:uncharacterized protein LOC133904817 n=1 Tax=Phragmites australis TaxID=29695 RepID=UPI002D78088F|nr:uncharacterized protein LOC133904817 [Phragmites australis]XP_062202374.1 uncharacterized protein LOC133904817 [Phragmites australis]XP_062202375.1 uncharacterized protein LOC133904817 [Phragmites australis]XP_062202376.1 uncharacterized protein LOC133904817 [Phragmites australis]
MDEPPLPPSHPPLELAGAARDVELCLSVALSREEVLRRRRCHLVQLYSLYRAQYWALADELPARYGEYWWDHGASPVLLDEPRSALPPPPPSLPLPENGCGVGPLVNGGGVGPLVNGVVGAVAPAAAGGRVGCVAANCEAKAMPLSLYCFNHILLDPKQQLYQPCAFITKQSGTPNGKAACGKPVLRGITPLRCADHDPKSQKLIIKALKNAGIDLPLTSKSVPKLSLLISETVREIQMKRKLSLTGAKNAPSYQSLK